jgi:hypothetical protein
MIAIAYLLLFCNDTLGLQTINDGYIGFFANIDTVRPLSHFLSKLMCAILFARHFEMGAKYYKMPTHFNF